MKNPVFNFLSSIIKPYGLLEIILVMFFILLPYSIANIGFAIVLPIILLLLCMIRTRLVLYPTTLAFRILVIYVLLHQFVLFFVLDPAPTYHLNSWLLLGLNLLSIFIVIPAVDFKKLLDAFKIVTIAVIIGELYHVYIMTLGDSISPIKIPLLPYNAQETRLTEVGLRPVSFFLEPSNLAQFYIFPLFFSLIYKKFFYSCIIVLAILLTTSTNGVAIAATMVLSYVVTQKVKLIRKIEIIIVSMAFVYAYESSSAFSLGKDKIESTKLEYNSRVMNGPILIKEMPIEHLICGFPSANVNDYIAAGNISTSELIISRNNNYFVSSFWLTIAKYGITGLLLFFAAYYSIYKRNHRLIVLLLPLLVLKFSGGAMFNSATLVWTTFMFSFIEFEKTCKKST